MVLLVREVSFRVDGAWLILDQLGSYIAVILDDIASDGHNAPGDPEQRRVRPNESILGYSVSKDL